MITKLLIAALLAGPPIVDDLLVRWAGPPECEGEGRVVERLRVLAPELSIAELEAPAVVTARVLVERGPGLQWLVRLDLDGPQGTEHRTFVAESCGVAIDATALVLAVAIDPGAVAAHINWQEPAVEAPPPPEPPPPAASEALTEPLTSIVSVPVHADPVRSEPDPLPRVRLGVTVLGGGGYGPLRAGSATLMGGLAVLGERWRAQLRGAWLPPLRPALGDRGRARVDGFVVGAQGCGVLRAGHVEFPLCAGIEAGAVRAQALEPIQNPATASQPYVGFVLGPGLSWAPIERVALGVEVQALIPIVFGGFALDGQPVLDSAPAGVRALAGVELRFP